MLSVQEALQDPELGAVRFTVRRPHYIRERGAPVRDETTSSEAVGCVYPAPDRVTLTDAEEAVDSAVRVYTAFPLSAGNGPDETGAFTGADEIVHNGGIWRVAEVTAFPGCVRALAVYQKEDET